MGKKLFVGSIPYGAEDEDLKEHFSTIGEVALAKIITDRATGQSKGFGFVEMATEEEARRAIDELNGSSFMDRPITVNEARPQQPREKRGFRGKGGYGGKGDYGGGRGGYGGARGSGSRGNR